MYESETLLHHLTLLSSHNAAQTTVPLLFVTLLTRNPQASFKHGLGLQAEQLTADLHGGREES
jgi:hypothetical protein